MAKKPISLDDLLNPRELDDLLAGEAPRIVSPPEERDILSPPEAVILHWRKDTCSCGRVYESQEHAPTIRHTLSRRIGFGLRSIGKVYIPALPGTDLSNIPQEVKLTSGRIYACPDCIGQQRSLALFPELEVTFVADKAGNLMPPHVARWRDMHRTSPNLELENTLKSMKKRQIDFDGLLAFKTTHLDLQAVLAGQVLCDPERQIES